MGSKCKANNRLVFRTIKDQFFNGRKLDKLRTLSTDFEYQISQVFMEVFECSGVKVQFCNVHWLRSGSIKSILSFEFSS